MKKTVRFAEEEEKQNQLAPSAAVAPVVPAAAIVADMEMATQPLAPAEDSSSSSISSSSENEEDKMEVEEPGQYTVLRTNGIMPPRAAPSSSYVEMMNQATQPLDSLPLPSSPPPFRLNYQYSQPAADEMEVVQEEAEEEEDGRRRQTNYQLPCGIVDARQVAIAHLTSPEGRREEEERQRKLSLDHPSSEEEELPARVQLAPPPTTSSPAANGEGEEEEEAGLVSEEQQKGLESMIVPLVTVGLKMEEVREQEIRAALPSASMSNPLVSTIVNSFMWQMRSGGGGDDGDWKHAKDNEASAWKKKLVEIQRKLGANRLSSCEEGGYEMNGPILVAVPVPNKVNWCFVLLIESLTWSEKTAGKCKQPKSERPLEQHIVSLVIPPLKEAGKGKMVFDAAGEPAYYAVPGPLWLTTLLPGSKVKRASINANHWKVLDAKSNTWLPLWDVLGLEKSNETTPIFARMKFSSEPSVRATHALCMSYENTYNPNTKENRALARAAKGECAGDSSSPLAVSPKRGGKKTAAKRDASPKRGGRKKKGVVEESKREKRERKKLAKKAEKKLMRKELVEAEGGGKKKKGRKEKLSHDEVMRYIKRHPSMFDEEIPE